MLIKDPGSGRFGAWSREPGRRHCGGSKFCERAPAGLTARVVGRGGTASSQDTVEESGTRRLLLSLLLLLPQPACEDHALPPEHPQADLPQQPSLGSNLGILFLESASSAESGVRTMDALPLNTFTVVVSGAAVIASTFVRHFIHRKTITKEVYAATLPPVPLRGLD